MLANVINLLEKKFENVVLKPQIRKLKTISKTRISLN